MTRLPNTPRGCAVLREHGRCGILPQLQCSSKQVSEAHHIEYIEPRCRLNVDGIAAQLTCLVCDRTAPDWDARIMI